MPYPYLLFDADNTLFDFDQAERNAHLLLCRAHGLAFSEEGYQLYHKCNADLWRDFDRGLCITFTTAAGMPMPMICPTCWAGTSICRGSSDRTRLFLMTAAA